VLSAPPHLSQQTHVLLHAVAAEQNLIWVYAKVMALYPALAGPLAPLRAEHEAHLDQLRARVIEPPGRQSPAAVTARPLIAGPQAAALVQLRAAEQAAVTAQMGRLAAAPASLAQLYASIAACESTHVGVLTARISTR